MYQLTATPHILRLADDAFIWPDADNSDYAAYLAWVAEGNTPSPAPVEDTRPAVMADFKARREVYLNRLTGIAGRATRAGETALANAADAFSEGLLALPDDARVVAAADGAELKQAVMLCYALLVRAAVASCPESGPAFDRVSK